MRITAMWRYPVKSFGGEALNEARFELGGMPFDRRIAVIDSDPARAGKPLNGRRQQRLVAYSARVVDGEIVVKTPAGVEHAASGDAWRSELEAEFGVSTPVTRSDDAIHDDSDVLVINAASLRELAREYGCAIDPLRFRPNLIVEGPELGPFDELAWPGSEFHAGDAVLRASYPCRRCSMTTVDPATLTVDPAFLKTVVQRHAGNFGIYCEVVQAGTIRVGDEWRVCDGRETQG